MSGICMFQSNLTRITGTLHEDQYTFSTISHLIILRTKIFFFQKKNCRGNQNTYFMFNNFLLFENALCMLDD